MSVLDEAGAVVDGPRRASYGSPAENHGRTAAMWSAYLGVKITARQVCMLNILQKVSRDAHSARHDNLVDLCGYARNAELIEEERDAELRAAAQEIRDLVAPHPLLQDLPMVEVDPTKPLPPLTTKMPPLGRPRGVWHEEREERAKIRAQMDDEGLHHD